MSNTRDTAIAALLEAHHALNPCETEQDKELSRKAFTAGYNAGIRQSQSYPVKLHPASQYADEEEGLEL